MDIFLNSMSEYSFGNLDPLFGPAPNSALLCLVTSTKFYSPWEGQKMCTETFLPKNPKNLWFFRLRGQPVEQDQLDNQ